VPEQLYARILTTRQGAVWAAQLTVNEYDALLGGLPARSPDRQPGRFAAARAGYMGCRQQRDFFVLQALGCALPASLNPKPPYISMLN